MCVRNTLAHNVDAFMKCAKINTQVELAKRSGVSQTQIGNILRAHKGTSLDTISRLANALQCETWQLLAPISSAVENLNEDFALMAQSILGLPAEDSELFRRLALRFYFLTQNCKIE